MKITSREQAIEKLGQLGADIWDGVEEYDHRIICGEDYVFYKCPPKLESLTDEGLEAEYIKANSDHATALRAVVTADREREREILAQETEEELLEKIKRNIEREHMPVAERRRQLIATVRAHDRAKGVAPPLVECGESGESWKECIACGQELDEPHNWEHCPACHFYGGALHRAKGQQYPEPRPVSEWKEEMGTCLFWESIEHCWEKDWRPDDDHTHFFPLPKEPK